MKLLRAHLSTSGKISFSFLLLLILFSDNSIAQNASLWQDVNSGIVSAYGSRYSTPVAFRSLQLDISGMRNYLQNAPMEFSVKERSSAFILTLPMPDGSFSDFEIFESPVMAASLAAKYPQIKTFTGSGITDRRAHIRLDVTVFGFHAMILSPKGDIFIDPVSNESADYYIVYNKKDLHREYAFDCGVKSEDENINIDKNEGHTNANKSTGSQLRTYRLALACTGEYAATKGGTVVGALSGMTTSINRVTGIYESEFAIRMELIANDTELIYLSAATDPYTNNDGYIMLDENQNNIDDVIGSANYDFGHVFSTGGGGIAGLGVICNNNQKANGVTGLFNPVGDAFDVDYVAHEMGHEFGANHTFNSTSGGCGGGTRWAGTAYEPGSGSTIMGYAGLCAPNDLQPHSDPFFHTASYDEITNYTINDDGSTCAAVVSTGNTPPSADAGTNYTIPFETPFKLTGTASDADGDSLSYMWDEIDKGPSCNMNAPTGNAPSFRSFKTDTVPYRYFPRLSSIVTGTVSNGETLPTYARTLKFRFIVRDNTLNGGGLTYDDLSSNLTVINTTTPFRVTYPTTADNWAIGTSYHVSWDVSTTNQNPINCQNVNILLSLDGGYTYPVSLVSTTPNDGNEEVTIPLDVSLLTTKARIMVQSAGNVFFDISDQNFTIGSNTGIQNANALSDKISIFPNPSNGVFTIALDQMLENSSDLIRITDVVGKIVFEQSIKKSKETQQITVDLCEKPNGIYFVELSTGSSTAVKKIVKQ